MRLPGVTIGVLASLLAFGSFEAHGEKGSHRVHQPIDDRLGQWARANADAQYGGTWVEGEQVVIGFADDPGTYEAHLRSELGLSNLKVVRVERSLRTLTEIQQALDADTEKLSALGVIFSGSGIRADRSAVVLSVRGNVEAALDFVRNHYPLGSVEVQERKSPPRPV